MFNRIALAVALTLPLASAGLASYGDFTAVPVSPQLQSSVEQIARTTTGQYPDLKPEDLAITLIDLDEKGDATARASYHGEAGFYPASVVKLFVMAGAYERMKQGKLEMTAELLRGLQDMIGKSSNDATSYMIDAVSGTTSGPELEGKAWDTFVRKRTWLTNYFKGLGYDVNVPIKTFCEGPYGRENQLLGANYENRNRVTGDAIAALLYDLARARLVSPGASQSMLNLMRRDLGPGKPGEEDQVHGFGGEALPPDSKLWSKAGWTSTVRHDSMLVMLPNGRRYIAVILTRGATAGDEKLLPFISGKLAALFQ